MLRVANKQVFDCQPWAIDSFASPAAVGCAVRRLRIVNYVVGMVKWDGLERWEERICRETEQRVMEIAGRLEGVEAGIERLGTKLERSRELVQTFVAQVNVEAGTLTVHYALPLTSRRVVL